MTKIPSGDVLKPRKSTTPRTTKPAGGRRSRATTPGVALNSAALKTVTQPSADPQSAASTSNGQQVEKPQVPSEVVPFQFFLLQLQNLNDNMASAPCYCEREPDARLRAPGEDQPNEHQGVRGLGRVQGFEGSACVEGCFEEEVEKRRRGGGTREFGF
jgi:hypothetical protein